ncbi:hypothetical protein PY829_004415 [Salmonella enterica]|nr:hypothetical protein [Salmonella enterica subsp. enterica serovar Panama]EGX9176797.1 hypothetical protein [Salmonella enterica]EDS5483790.1 hypothetical protein [Salmonella enterica subsp. enterica serovar Panama]EGZ6498272.1 hypothetical protein [Salmonella enterica]EJG5926371.1 hypothetical protein [Salmonella enterica]
MLTELKIDHHENIATHETLIREYQKKSRKRGSAAAKDCSGLLLCNTITADSSLVSDFPALGY